MTISRVGSTGSVPHSSREVQGSRSVETEQTPQEVTESGGDSFDGTSKKKSSLIKVPQANQGGGQMSSISGVRTGMRSQNQRDDASKPVADANKPYDQDSLVRGVTAAAAAIAAAGGGGAVRNAQQTRSSGTKPAESVNKQPEPEPVKNGFFARMVELQQAPESPNFAQTNVRGAAFQGIANNSKKADSKTITPEESKKIDWLPDISQRYHYAVSRLRAHVLLASQKIEISENATQEEVDSQIKEEIKNNSDNRIFSQDERAFIAEKTYQIAADPSKFEGVSGAKEYLEQLRKNAEVDRDMLETAQIICDAESGHLQSLRESKSLTDTELTELRSKEIQAEEDLKSVEEKLKETLNPNQSWFQKAWASFKNLFKSREELEQDSMALIKSWLKEEGQVVDSSITNENLKEKVIALKTKQAADKPSIWTKFWRKIMGTAEKPVTSKALAAETYLSHLIEYQKYNDKLSALQEKQKKFESDIGQQQEALKKSTKNLAQARLTALKSQTIYKSYQADFEDYKKSLESLKETIGTMNELLADLPEGVSQNDMVSLAIGWNSLEAIRQSSEKMNSKGFAQALDTLDSMDEVVSKLREANEKILKTGMIKGHWAATSSGRMAAHVLGEYGKLKGQVLESMKGAYEKEQQAAEKALEVLKPPEKTDKFTEAVKTYLSDLSVQERKIDHLKRYEKSLKDVVSTEVKKLGHGNSIVQNTSEKLDKELNGKNERLKEQQSKEKSTSNKEDEREEASEEVSELKLRLAEIEKEKAEIKLLAMQPLGDVHQLVIEARAEFKQAEGKLKEEQSRRIAFIREDKGRGATLNRKMKKLKDRLEKEIPELIKEFGIENLSGTSELRSKLEQELEEINREISEREQDAKALEQGIPSKKQEIEERERRVRTEALSQQVTKNVGDLSAKLKEKSAKNMENLVVNQIAIVQKEFHEGIEQGVDTSIPANRELMLRRYSETLKKLERLQLETPDSFTEAQKTIKNTIKEKIKEQVELMKKVPASDPISQKVQKDYRDIISSELENPAYLRTVIRYHDVLRELEILGSDLKASYESLQKLVSLPDEHKNIDVDKVDWAPGGVGEAMLLRLIPLGLVEHRKVSAQLAQESLSLKDEMSKLDKEVEEIPKSSEEYSEKLESLNKKRENQNKQARENNERVKNLEDFGKKLVEAHTQVKRSLDLVQERRFLAAEIAQEVRIEEAPAGLSGDEPPTPAAAAGGEQTPTTQPLSTAATPTVTNSDSKVGETVPKHSNLTVANAKQKITEHINARFDELEEKLKNPNFQIVVPGGKYQQGKSNPNAQIGTTGYAHNLGIGFAIDQWGTGPEGKEASDEVIKLITERLTKLSTTYPDRIVYGWIGKGSKYPIGKDPQSNKYYYHVWGANAGNWDKQGSKIDGLEQAQSMRESGAEDGGFGIVTTPVGGIAGIS